MRNLLLFISRYYPVFLFLILEVVSLLMIGRSNAYQGATMVNSANHITGSFYEKQNDIASYLNLRETNDILEEENAMLRRLIGNYQRLADSGYVDTTGVDIYEFIPATVINHTVNKKLNYFTLDRGEAEGMIPGMGVIDPRGLVGMITNVSANYAVGISMLNLRTRVSVKHKRSGAIGIMRWPGNDPTVHIIEDITKTARVQVGDTIITSGYSTYFPGGLNTAVVTSARLEEGSNFYEIEARLTNDILSLDRVYVVQHFQRAEVDSLETAVEQ